MLCALSVGGWVSRVRDGRTRREAGAKGLWRRCIELLERREWGGTRRLPAHRDQGGGGIRPGAGRRPKRRTPLLLFFLRSARSRRRMASSAPSSGSGAAAGGGGHAASAAAESTASATAIDMDLYSRQIGVFGLETCVTVPTRRVQDLRPAGGPAGPRARSLCPVLSMHCVSRVSGWASCGD